MVALVAALTLATLLPLAAVEARVGRRADREPFRELMFGPELVMSHQREIGLTPEQRQLFIREVQQTQSDLVPTQVEMTAASADLLALLEGERVDEEAALAAAERLIELEQEVKTRHMRLLVRIKNLLTIEQQRLLRELRDDG